MRYFLILFSYFIINHAVALDITYTNLNPYTTKFKNNTEALYLKGEIQPGDYRKLVEIIYNDVFKFITATRRSIILASEGGDVNEALKIARLVKGVRASVSVGPVTGKCISACFLIYAAAVERDASAGTIGIHRPYLHPQQLSELSPNQAEQLQSSALSQSRKYLLELQIPTNIIDIMFQRASTEIHWLTRHELVEEIGIWQTWYEQYLIARCGLDKELEKKAYREADKDLFLYLGKIGACGKKLTAKESSAFIWKEFAKLKK